MYNQNSSLDSMFEETEEYWSQVRKSKTRGPGGKAWVKLTSSLLSLRCVFTS